MVQAHLSASSRCSTRATSYARRTTSTRRPGTLLGTPDARSSIEPPVATGPARWRSVARSSTVRRATTATCSSRTSSSCVRCEPPAAVKPCPSTSSCGACRPRAPLPVAASASGLRRVRPPAPPRLTALDPAIGSPGARHASRTVSASDRRHLWASPSTGVDAATAPLSSPQPRRCWRRCGWRSAPFAAGSQSSAGFETAVCATTAR